MVAGTQRGAAGGVDTTETVPAAAGRYSAGPAPRTGLSPAPPAQPSPAQPRRPASLDDWADRFIAARAAAQPSPAQPALAAVIRHIFKNICRQYPEHRRRYPGSGGTSTQHLYRHLPTLTHNTDPIQILIFCIACKTFVLLNASSDTIFKSSERYVSTCAKPINF